MGSRGTTSRRSSRPTSRSRRLRFAAIDVLRLRSRLSEIASEESWLRPEKGRCAGQVSRISDYRKLQIMEIDKSPRPPGIRLRAMRHGAAEGARQRGAGREADAAVHSTWLWSGH